MTRPAVRQAVLASVLTVLVGIPTVLTTVHGQGAPGGLPDLVGMLKATPGVLGVEAARTASGKQVIFAWFENKQAMLTWYYSAAHVKLMEQFAGAARRPDGPLAGVPDDGRPVLAIASLTMAAPPQNGDLKAATTQIAIELYAPVPGGLSVGGRFAPSTVKVAGLIELEAVPANTK
jgi:hypothetical protein